MTDITYRLAQKRTIVTPLPGPRSGALAERRRAAVSAGVGSTAPVYAVDADGGVIVDADGNSFIDLGAGIAVTTVGASHPAVAAAIADQATHFTHTCFMVTPYEGYVQVAELLNALTPAIMTSAPHCSTRVPRPSRTPSRWHGWPPGDPPWSHSTTPITDAPT